MTAPLQLQPAHEAGDIPVPIDDEALEECDEPVPLTGSRLPPSHPA